MGYFEVALSARAELDADPDLASYITPFAGTVRYTRHKDGKSFRVGRFLCHRVYADRATDAGLSMYELLDNESQEMGDLYGALFDPATDDLAEDVQMRFETIGTDLLVLDYVILHPRWRGLKLGLLVARKLVDLLGAGCALTVSNILPLNPDAHEPFDVPAGWIPRHETAPELAAARRALGKYFRRMGFRRVGKSSVHALSMTRTTPTLADIIRPPQPPG